MTSLKSGARETRVQTQPPPQEPGLGLGQRVIFLHFNFLVFKTGIKILSRRNGTKMETPAPSPPRNSKYLAQSLGQKADSHCLSQPFQLQGDVQRCPGRWPPYRHNNALDMTAPGESSSLPGGRVVLTWTRARTQHRPGCAHRSGCLGASRTCNIAVCCQVWALSCRPSRWQVETSKFECLLFGARTWRGSPGFGRCSGKAAPDSAKFLLCDLGEVSHPLWARSFLHL